MSARSWNMSDLNGVMPSGAVTVTPPTVEGINSALEPYGEGLRQLDDGKYAVQNKSHILKFNTLHEVAAWVDCWCLGIGLR